MLIVEQVRINILYMTRNFPPKRGGMEKVAYELHRYLSERSNVTLIKWGGSNKWLPLVLPFFLLKVIWFLLTKKIQVIYLQDGLLAPLGLILKIFKKKIAITIHGKDIAYKNTFYQFLIPRCLKRLDKIICVSTALKLECLKRGIPKEKVIIIKNGISDEFYINEDKRSLLKKLNFSFKIKDKIILLSVGRLVEKKGFHWFVEKVVPKILEKTNSFVYLIVGDGRLRKDIEKSIIRNDLKDFVFMLGKVDDEAVKLIYNISDIFVMPNIRAYGDFEGFGVVALEAASCELPVVASSLEGVKDAVQNSENGFLIKPNYINGFVSKIIELSKSERERKEFGKKARKFTLENYGWEKIADKYLEAFEKIISENEFKRIVET